MALLKLGIFLRDQRAWKQGKKAVQGVIIFGPPDADSRCYVVSVAKPPSVSNAEVSMNHISCCCGPIPGPSAVQLRSSHLNPKSQTLNPKS